MPVLPCRQHRLAHHLCPGRS